MLVAQYQLMQLCIKHGDGEVVRSPGRPGATHHGATRHAQQPVHGIFLLAWAIDV
ncbi:hypothetical protein ACLK1U_18305 [Escherichia coli]